MLDYKKCPELMRQQVKENRKDMYIEIVQSMLAWSNREMDIDEKFEYVTALRDVLAEMDFQIYELYRSLADTFTDAISDIHTFLLENEDHTCIQWSLWKELLTFGEQKHFLLQDWFVSNEKTVTDLKEKETIQLKLLLTTPRSATVELVRAGKYETEERFFTYVNGKKVEAGDTVVRSVFGLLPEQDYELVVLSEDGKKAGKLVFRTGQESVTLNVKDFGAVGDGINDDTHAIQTAIMNCPKQGRVLIPQGIYSVKSLFLKSDMQLELSKGAEIRAIPERKEHGIQPGVLPGNTRGKEYHFGTWEGNPLPMFSGVLSGIEVENVMVYGEGVLNGNASKETWWRNPKVMDMAYRPRLFFLRDSSKVYLQGITLQNSPSWTIHPFFSKDLGFYNLSVRNPFDSPNTDGLDPESCRGVEIAGVNFSLGDDCIAVKSGKIYMGRKYKQPSESIRIHNCFMQNGHGAVTIGSEMAGGVKNLTVEDCNFAHTDRGLRIKTRRGRGQDAILDRIIFRNIDMDHVMTPFVVNSFYFCDPDGKTAYVQSRDVYPVDERTPLIKRLEFEDILAKNCHVAAAYMEGLPELKIEEVIMRHVEVSFAENPKCDVPAMSEGVEACTRKGIFLKNVKRVTLDHVSVQGCDGDEVTVDGIDEFNRV